MAYLRTIYNLRRNLFLCTLINKATMGFWNFLALYQKMCYVENHTVTPQCTGKEHICCHDLFSSLKSFEGKILLCNFMF